MNVSPVAVASSSASVLMGVIAEMTQSPSLAKATMIAVIVTCFVICVHILLDCHARNKAKAERKRNRERRRSSDIVST